MKTYQVELIRTSYVAITVDAESQEQAEEMAWEELRSGDDSRHDAHWEINYTEVIA